MRLGPVQVQPSELAKLALLVFFASYLVAKRDVLSLASRRVAGLDLPRGRDLGPVLLAWGASLAVLVFEKDLGRSLLFFGIFIAMLYVATERTCWLLIGLVLFAGGAYVAYLLFGHVRVRVDVWLHPFAHPDSDRLPAGAVAVRLRHRRPDRHRSRRGQPRPRCRSPRPTSSSPASARSWAWPA